MVLLYLYTTPDFGKISSLTLAFHFIHAHDTNPPPPQVFIDALRTYEPPLMDRDRLAGFIREVFWNIDALTAHHRRMLDQLFARQREQHPVILSVADIVLDSESFWFFHGMYDVAVRWYGRGVLINAM
jgi:hypothetical protein